jgi:hypothetical protein
VLVTAIAGSKKQSERQDISIDSIEGTEKEPQALKEGPLVRGIGEIVPCGKRLEMIVHKAYRGTSTNKLSQPKPGNYYLVVELELKNIGSEVEHVSILLQMSLKDESGREYDPTPLVPDLYTFPEGTIAPGEKVRGTIPFEVPTAVTSGLIFKFDPMFGDPVFVVLPPL